jgi:uroporphyrinogen III methyltransferase/synthase
MSAPLTDQVVVVTRPQKQSADLVRALEELGAAVHTLPLIETEPLEATPRITGAVARLADYDIVILTSAMGVECFADRLDAAGAEVGPTTTVVAIGAATSAALAARGIASRRVSDEATGPAIVEALGPELPGRSVLLPRARLGRSELPAGLRAAGALVDDVAFYETVDLVPDPSAVAAAFPADVVVFTAPSAVRNACASIGTDRLRGCRLVSIGPTTAAAIRDAGLDVAAEAQSQTVDGLVEAVRIATGR